ncbi:hypothetical protein B0H12DRAFT_1093008 [Mycena haematopus]|nr:hypothetical protein B0H12DRAFT_1093008 [Mycena haematopus]
MSELEKNNPIEPFAMFLISGLASASTIGPWLNLPKSTYLWDSTRNQFVSNLGSAFCDIRVHTSITAQYAGFYHRPYGGAMTEVCAEVPGAVPPFSVFSAFIDSHSQMD